MPTGTVTALLLNISTYDALISQKEAGGEGAQDLDQKLAQVADEIKDAVPVLVKLGMFDLFSVDEWCAGNRPGRNLVGKFTKELGGP